MVVCRITQVVGSGVWDAVKVMAADLPNTHKKTLATDKSHYTKGMVAELRRIAVRPRVARNTFRPACYAID